MLTIFRELIELLTTAGYEFNAYCIPNKCLFMSLAVLRIQA